jgi:2-haloacid dehalogenase
MAITLAFDVYGTLIDTHGVVAKLKESVGDLAREFSQTWRDKQLEYSFRRGLMQNYQTFAICTQQALDYTCTYYKVNISADDKLQLLESYRSLPAFDDVSQSLSDLKKAGFRLYAFSNGNQDAVEALLNNTGIRDYFFGVVSVDDLKSFKPNPAVYSYFLRQSGTTAGNAWLISSNPFDVIGAVSHGMRGAWVQRTPDAIFDPWGIEPTTTVTSLLQLNQKISNY